jgi:geranylgeranyl reductase family protein
MNRLAIDNADHRSGERQICCRSRDLEKNAVTRHTLRLKFEVVLLLSIVMALMITSPISAQTGIQATDLGKLYEGDRFSAAHDINDRGQVAGTSQYDASHSRAFLWTDHDGMRDLGTLGGGWSLGTGINNRGQVIGRSQTNSGAYNAFLWTERDGMVDLGTLGGNRGSLPTDINERGKDSLSLLWPCQFHTTMPYALDLSRICAIIGAPARVQILSRLPQFLRSIAVDQVQDLESRESRLKTDVVVVGAGPSGCAAASVLAENGLKVTLIDRARFPRDKVCGDGVTPRALACLQRLGLGPWLQAGSFVQLKSMAISFPGGQQVRVMQSPELPSLGTVIPRRKLDQALLEQALGKGVTFLDETRALGAATDRQSITVECANHERRTSLQARVVLAGDGSTAPFSRRIGLVQGRPNVIAVRAYVRGDRLDVDAYHVRFLANLLPWYTWIFPAAPGLFNVGVGAQVKELRKKGIKLQSLLGDLLASQHARQVTGTCRQIGPIGAHPLRMPGIRAEQLAAERVLVIGDAASMINPLSGEGIGPALESGTIAAEHVCLAFQEGDFSRKRLSSYAVEIQKRFGADYRAASILRDLMTNPLVAHASAKLGRREPEFALMLTKAVLSQCAGELLRPSTWLKGTLYWPVRAVLRGILQTRQKAPRA